MKKLIVSLSLIVSMFFTPYIVSAGGSSDDKAVGMVTSECYYKGKENDEEYILMMEFQGITNMGPSSAGNVIIKYYNLQKEVLFSYGGKGAEYGSDYIYNYNKDFGTYFAVEPHMNNIWNENDESDETLTKAAANGKFCPSTVYKTYDKTNKKYMFMFCNGYNEHLEQDTCSNVSNYIKKNKSKFADDTENMTINKYSFVKSFSWGNVGRDDPNGSDISDTYVDVKDEIEENKENTSQQDNIGNVIDDLAKDNIIDAADNQGISEEELETYYAEVKKMQINLDDLTCNDLLGSPEVEGTPAYYLAFGFRMMKYVAIIILIVMSVMDYVGAITSQDNEIIQKTTTKVIKRAILCVIIFLLPTLIEFIMQYMHERAIEICILK